MVKPTVQTRIDKILTPFPIVIVTPKSQSKKEKRMAKIMEELITNAYETTFQHIYFLKGFFVSASVSLDGKYHYPTSTHGCLRMGYWCWYNFFSRPFDIFPYLKHKLSLRQRVP